MANILFLDIETAPNLAYVWRVFKENIGVNQIMKHSELLSFACKWMGSDEIFYMDKRNKTEKVLLQTLLSYLDQADYVIAHNGARFDIPTIQGRAAVYRLKPPSPYKVIDTYLMAKKEFTFPRHSLEYLCEVFNVERKTSHKKFPGFELWRECLSGNNEAWEEMKNYNIHDVISLEQIYYAMRPWVKQHPNFHVHNENEEVGCPTCGSTHMQRRGFAYTNTGKYQRYQCQDCSSWSRTRYTENTLEKRKGLLVNV